MAKGKYQKWLTKPKLAVLTNWARMGLSDPQIAHNMGISYSTFKVWKAKYPAISAAVEEGKEVVDAVVVNALIKAAKNGNVQAITFWLRNRMPEYFRDNSYKELNEAQAQKADADKRISLAQATIVEAQAKKITEGTHTQEDRLDELLDKITDDDDVKGDDNDSGTAETVHRKAD
ncbi:helix-turn-helix domain-containing protein [Lacticaseibacillus zhaodongensis]|uniref:helix-turn-helix domain-containing protein n=1 Tax=Lacticaseibacillus zhaodongensis TaxID=2668065 RepID=UPI0012D30D55|nr:helix-turn-helix domain-containing protein [Lacticaseibacillus zhaodongensis]